MSSIGLRVAHRALELRVGKTFHSPEALEEYIKQHPGADRTKHKVDKTKAPGGPKDEPGAKKPPAGKPPPLPPSAKPPAAPEAPPKAKPPPIPEAAKKRKPEGEKPQGEKPATPPPKPEGPKPAPQQPAEKHEQSAPKPAGRFDGWKKSLKGLGQAATKFVQESPKAIKSFLGDPDFRKHAIAEAKTAVTQLPKKAVHRLVETAKEEVHEYKTAAAGIKAAMSGKKMTKHQKHAFRQVATHMAIGATAAAFAATGPLAGAAVFSKNLATHVALKSVKKALGSLHTMQEVGHIGHGVGHLLEHIASEGDSKEIDPEEAMTNLILAAVAKEIEQLKDEDFTRVLNEVSDEGDDAQDEEDAQDDDDTAINDKTAALHVLRRFVG